MFSRAATLGLFLSLSTGLANEAHGLEYTIAPGESIFAIVTHKAGIASTFAHNHIVFARNFSATLDADDKTGLGTFRITIPVKELDLDTAEMQTKWYPTFSELEILREPFSKVSKSDQEKVAELMLGSSQLDEKKFPQISATVTSVEDKTTRVGKKTFPKLLELAVTIHGKTVTRKIPAEVVFSGPKLEAQAIGAFKFTEFGIEPYSGMLGAVRNQDEFHLYAKVKATLK